jgi:hypothetical protein
MFDWEIGFVLRLNGRDLESWSGQWRSDPNCPARRVSIGFVINSARDRASVSVCFLSRGRTFVDGTPSFTDLFQE